MASPACHAAPDELLVPSEPVGGATQRHELNFGGMLPSMSQAITYHLTVE